MLLRGFCKLCAQLCVLSKTVVAVTGRAVKSQFGFVVCNDSRDYVHRNQPQVAHNLVLVHM